MGAYIYRAAFAEVIMTMAVEKLAAFGANAFIATANMTYHDKKGILQMLADEYVSFPECLELKRIIAEIDRSRNLRQFIAHCMWVDGNKPGHIKPYSAVVKGRLKLIGHQHNEKEYSAREIIDEAKRLGSAARDLINFLRHVGMFGDEEESIAESYSSNP